MKTRLLVAVAIVAVFVACAAFAATINITENDLTVTGVLIRFEGGNCHVRPIVEVNIPQYRYIPVERTVTGARCNTIRDLTVRAANLDAQVGDGGAP